MRLLYRTHTDGCHLLLMIIVCSVSVQYGSSGYRCLDGTTSCDIFIFYEGPVLTGTLFLSATLRSQNGFISCLSSMSMSACAFKRVSKIINRYI